MNRAADNFFTPTVTPQSDIEIGQRLAQMEIRRIASDCAGDSSRGLPNRLVKVRRLPHNSPCAKRNRFHFLRLEYGELAEDAILKQHFVTIDSIPHGISDGLAR